MDKEERNKVHSSTQIFTTKDYEQFKKLKGNRPNDPAKIKRLIHNMMNVGNLTAEFPVVVNERMEIIDGQHRVAALKELEWPVGYRIHTGLTLDTVRGINQAGSNWGWKDYATSFAEDGTPEQRVQYGMFLALHEEFGYGYSRLANYCGLGDRGRKRNVLFTQGELVVPHYDRTVKFLKQYAKIVELLNHETLQFSKAMYKVMQHPDYDQKRMENKCMIYDQEIAKQGTQEAYLRLIEHIYNRHQPEDSRVRLY